MHDETLLKALRCEIFPRCSIIIGMARAETPWIVAMHRFLEVAIGILVALAVVALWREKDDALE